MNSYLNEFTGEWWRGAEDRTAAPDYVTRLPLKSASAPLVYTGRIGGVRTDDQPALIALRDQITREVAR